VPLAARATVVADGVHDDTASDAGSRPFGFSVDL